jgi:hypothetical protein
MSILGFIKDVVLLPVDIALDLTMITPGKRIIDAADDPNKNDSPFGTIDRIKSMVDNLDETRK